MNKKELLDKIKQLEGLNSDEKAYLLNLVNTKKKYGLVWEDKPEDVEEELRTKLPVLREVKDKAIVNGDEYPNHILIEGDNLHALTALTFTHEEAIDLIYIDPPYNTGNKDFIYNDQYVDKEDSYRHSKWLSFIQRRLVIAKTLLSKHGALFISIDDNEQSNLTLLCDEIFGEQNRIAVLPTIMNLKGNQDQFAFAGTHEYTLVYTKNKSLFKPSELPYDQEELESWIEDDLGFYKKGAPLRATGAESLREDRPFMFYPILISSEDTVTTITDEEFDFLYDKASNSFDDNFIDDLIIKYSSLGFDVVFPMVDDSTFGRWRWGFSLENKKRLSYDIIVNRSGRSITLYKKQRPGVGDIPTKKPKSLFYKPEYSSGNGTSQLKNILGSKIFDNPKPRDLILDVLRIGLNNNGIVLDFFAGSGTTLDAILHLNQFEKRTINGIIVTNNENEIAEKVTYQRVQKLINSDFFDNNVRYYQCDFVDRKPTLANKRKLTTLATELLCIKEDTYKEVTSLLEKADWHRLFSDGKGKYVYIVYDELYIDDAVELLEEFISEHQPEEKVKVYVFSNGQYAYTEEFESLAEKVELAALPDAIYKALAQVLPKENREDIPELEDEISEDQAAN